MNIVMTLIVALVVIVVHVWLCNLSPKFWYLGGWCGIKKVDSLFSRIP